MGNVGAAAKAKSGGTSEERASAAKAKKDKRAAPAEPAHADELAAAGVADEEAEMDASESATGSENDDAEGDEGTSTKKPKKEAILKAPGAKQKPGKVCWDVSALLHMTCKPCHCLDRHMYAAPCQDPHRALILLST